MRTSTTLVCKSANIEDRFPNDEIPRILARLPQIIREQYGLVEGAPQTEMLRFRVTEKEKNEIEHTAREMGYASVSAYLRDVALQNGPERVLDQ
jgi:hypothetical protein